jgi:cytochrome c oxidase subunit 2
MLDRLMPHRRGGGSLEILLKQSRLVVFAVAFIALMLSTIRVTAAEQEIEIHAKKFEFVPAEITLKQGVPVKLKLVSDDVEHSLVIAGLGVKQDMKVGQPAEITVTPTATGDFKGDCGVFCGIGHGKMHLIVHVVPK